MVGALLLLPLLPAPAASPADLPAPRLSWRLESGLGWEAALGAQARESHVSSRVPSCSPGFGQELGTCPLRA